MLNLTLSSREGPLCICWLTSSDPGLTVATGLLFISLPPSCSSPLHLLSAVWSEPRRPVSTRDRPHLQDGQGQVSLQLTTRRDSWNPPRKTLRSHDTVGPAIAKEMQWSGCPERYKMYIRLFSCVLVEQNRAHFMQNFELWSTFVSHF